MAIKTAYSGGHVWWCTNCDTYRNEYQLPMVSYTCGKAPAFCRQCTSARDAASLAISSLGDIEITDSREFCFTKRFIEHWRPYGVDPNRFHAVLKHTYRLAKLPWRMPTRHGHYLTY